MALVQLVSRGLPFEALRRFQRNVDLTLGELARLIHVQVRTLMRRKAEGRLQADESDRLLRASRLFARAIALFEGDLDAARGWLSARQPGLGRETPLELARTEVGVRQVEALIGRLEHGIPS